MRRFSSCSHTRTTFQPSLRRARPTSVSRSLLRVILARQNAALVFGHVACCGHPCQKHPSTNTANFSLGNTKSGLTEKGFFFSLPSVFGPLMTQPRRQPVMSLAGKIWISRSSGGLVTRVVDKAHAFRSHVLGKEVGHTDQYLGFARFAPRVFRRASTSLQDSLDDAAGSFGYSHNSLR